MNAQWGVLQLCHPVYLLSMKQYVIEWLNQIKGLFENIQLERLEKNGVLTLDLLHHLVMLEKDFQFWGLESVFGLLYLSTYVKCWQCQCFLWKKKVICIWPAMTCEFLIWKTKKDMQRSASLEKSVLTLMFSLERFALRTEFCWVLWRTAVRSVRVLKWVFSWCIEVPARQGKFWGKIHWNQDA